MSSDRTAGASATSFVLRDRTTNVLALLLLGAFTLLVVAGMRVGGQVGDESHYVRSGGLIESDGWEEPITRVHGPLLYLFSGLLVGERPALERTAGIDPLVLFRARLGLLPFGLASAAVVFLWARRVFGNAGGLLALALTCFHPVFLGYSSVVSSDAIHTACLLACLALLARYLERPASGRLVALGSGYGLLLASKYLALLVAPGILLAAALRAGLQRGSVRLRIARTALAALLVPSVALGVMHAAYGFRAGSASTDPEDYRSPLVRGVLDVPVLGALAGVVPQPFLAGVDFQLRLGGEGNAEKRVFVDGRFRHEPRDFYLRALFWKTPEWTLLACAAGLIAIVTGAGRGAGPEGRRALALERGTLVLLGLTALVLVGYLSTIPRIRSGVRYVLPVLPLGGLLAGAVARPAWVARLGARGTALLGAAVLALSGLDVARAWPNELAYYNSSAGGTIAGWRHFNNSNSGWVLGRVGLERLRGEEAAFTALTGASGPRFGRVAIRTRDLVQPDPEDPARARHWLLAFEPVRGAGDGWWVFDVTRDAFRRAASEARDPRVRADHAVALLGAGDLAAAREELARLSSDPGGEAAGAAARALLERLEGAEAGAAAPGERARLVSLWDAVGRSDRVLELLASPPQGAAPDRREALWRARALAQEGRVDEAILVLEGLEALPEPALPLLFGLYRRTLRFDDAAALFRRLAEGLDGPATEELQQRLLELGDWAEARGPDFDPGE